MKHGTRDGLILTVLLAVAALLRWWGIWFGLPHTECRPDESITIQMVWRFGSGDFNPHYFFHPPLYPYLVFGVYGVYIVLALLSGRFVGVGDFIRAVAQDPSTCYVLTRLLSAAFGVATVAVLYYLGRRVSKDKQVGWLSAAFLAMAYLHVRDSHFGKDDVTSAFFLACSMLWILKSYDDRKVGSYLFAGMFAGLAMATKYSGVVLVPSLWLAHWLRSGRRRSPWVLLEARPMAFLAMLAVTFAACSPFMLMELPTFFTQVSGQLQHAGVGNVRGAGWWWYLRVGLWYGMGWPLFLASLAGLLEILRTRHEKGLILGAFLALYYGIIGASQQVMARYAIPLVPFLCVTAALWTSETAKRAGAALPKRAQILLPYAMGMVLASVSLARTVQFDRLMARRDSRLLATEWILEHVPRNSSITQIGTRPGKLQLPQTLESMQSLVDWANERGRGALAAARLELAKAQGVQGYQEWPYDPQHLPTYMLVQRSPLSKFALAKIPPELPAILDGSYRLVTRIETMPLDDPHNVYDDNDGFYLPYAGFRHVERPGPNIEIYEKH